MISLINYFNSILNPKGIYVHDINNTNNTKCEVEGVFRTSGGSISSGVDAEYSNEIANVSINFAIPCDNATKRENYIKEITAFMYATQNQEINFEIEDLRYLVSWNNSSQAGDTYFIGTSKMITFAIYGQVSISKALLNSNVLDIKIGYSQENLKRLTSVVSAPVVYECAMNNNPSNSNVPYIEATNSNRKINIDLWLLNDDACSIFYDYLNNTVEKNTVIYVDYNFQNGLFSIVGAFKIANISVNIVNGNFASASISLIESR